MTHIANQRIKLGGKVYKTGQTIVLTEADLNALPEGAVSLKSESDPDAPSVFGPPAPSELTEEFRLSVAVSGLEDGDFKKDGNIRADSLKRLIEEVGFDVSAEQVAKIKSDLDGKE